MQVNIILKIIFSIFFSIFSGKRNTDIVHGHVYEYPLKYIILIKYNMSSIFYNSPVDKLFYMFNLINTLTILDSVYCF